jgi:hypothetical protein
MAIAAVRVSPGMLPPTISTTPNSKAPLGIKFAAITRKAGVSKLEHEPLVGGEEQLERGTLLDLSCEVARRAVDYRYGRTCFLPVRRCDLIKGELEVGGRCDASAVLRRSVSGAGEAGHNRSLYPSLDDFDIHLCPSNVAR